jgi:hypothetical protein
VNENTDIPTTKNKKMNKNFFIAFNLTIVLPTVYGFGIPYQ